MTDDQIKAVYQQARWDWGGKGDVDAFFMAFGRALSQEAARQEREALENEAMRMFWDDQHPDDKEHYLGVVVRSRSPSTPVQGEQR